MKAVMRATDLFAGPGGWDVAARDLGLDVTGVESDHWACETRRAAGLRTVEGDVRDHGPLTLPSEGLIASPPCQTFSLAGLGAERAEMPAVIAAVAGGDERVFADERTALVLEPLRWVLEAHRAGVPYEWVAAEQVPTVLPVWEAYAQVMRGLGHHVVTGILHAEQYGVPQTRKRAILMARLARPVSLPEPTHSRYYPRDPGRLDLGVLPWVSMADALGWDEHVSVVSNYGTGGDPRARGVRCASQPSATVTSKADRARVAAVPGDTSWTHNRPSPTIVGSFAPDVVAAPGYRRAGDPPRQRTPGSVRVTPSQAAALQGFPADYPWRGATTRVYQQIGNAIPPPLARAVLHALTT